MENENEKCVLTIDKFCDNTEHFDNLSVGAETIVDSFQDGLKKKAVRGKIKRGSGGSTFGTACTRLSTIAITDNLEEGSMEIPNASSSSNIY